ncbi:hypothetical protein M975_2130 [Buttiauxella brennerae ATCC 51605]|uniref:DUF4832 domain-containing protein n=1 Tax=Buttiauxella brennerae ATCC 51605 TaxID=1354251 RepID=A0A1B7IR88_9ENTR|nr:DUF4832 domain-containing protein [Buttiauxella brennerae]OAT32238.1 hypothetical protein M975_2130 [Buttiauxella brennerae ATCC 51605]
MNIKTFVALMCMVVPGTALAESMTVVTPKALAGPLTNPGMGIASFHQGYGEQLTVAQYPDTGIEYERFYWSELEPVEGQYNYALVDDAFKFAAMHQPAMNVGLRFMALDGPESGSKIPDWLIKKGVKGVWTSDRKTFAPDLDDPIFFQYSQRLLNAFGKRYDGNENLAYVDIGMVGSWGEWHNSNFPSMKPLEKRYTPAQLEKYVRMHFAAFPKTPKIMLIAGGDNLVSAVKQGAGWRADCLGDWRNFSATWNLMEDDYPQRLDAAQSAYSGFNDAWKRAPVSFEICGYMPEWKTEQHYSLAEVQRTFDWAIEQHASTINLKSREVPKEYRGIVDQALTKLGYRFRLASLSHPAVVGKGASLALTSQWANDGIAPVYLKYDLTWRVVNGSDKVIAQGKTNDDIRTWLPGVQSANYRLLIPATADKGQYYIEVAMLDGHGKPRINLANEGKRNDGWYRVSKLNVE